MILFWKLLDSIGLSYLDIGILNIIIEMNEHDHLLLGFDPTIQPELISKSLDTVMTPINIQSLINHVRSKELNKFFNINSHIIQLHFTNPNNIKLQSKLFWILYALCKNIDKLDIFNIWLNPAYNETTNTVTVVINKYIDFEYFAFWLLGNKNMKPHIELRFPLPTHLFNVFKKYQILNNLLWHEIKLSYKLDTDIILPMNDNLNLQNNRIRYNIKSDNERNNFIASKMHVYSHMHIQMNGVINMIDLGNIIVGDINNIVHHNHPWYGTHKFGLSIFCFGINYGINTLILPQLFNGQRIYEMHLQFYAHNHQNDIIYITNSTIDMSTFPSSIYMNFNINDGIIQIFDEFTNIWHPHFR